jgi:hypothetical protein
MAVARFNRSWLSFDLAGLGCRPIWNGHGCRPIWTVMAVARFGQALPIVGTWVDMCDAPALEQENLAHRSGSMGRELGEVKLASDPCDP